MRIALISAIDTRGEEAEEALALRPLAGRSIVRRQLDLALELGCERIACLVEQPTPEIVRLQHAAEKAGARFNAVTGARALSGLVKAADEILVLASRVLADPALVRDALGGRPGLLVVPAERGVAVGFERIDRDHAWGGVMVLHGSAVERLADLPSDSDPISALLRIGAQFGSRRVLLAPGIMESGELTLVGDQPALALAEKRWLHRSAGRGAWRRPVSAVIGALVRMLAPRLLSRPRAPLVADGLGTILAAGGGVLAWFEQPAAGLAVLALAAASYLCAQVLRAVERGSTLGLADGWQGDLVVDAVFIGSAVAASPRNPGMALFCALVGILAIRLAVLHGPTSRLAVAGDRVLLIAMAALAAAAGKLVPFIQLVALAVLVADLVERTRTRLTRA